MRTTCFVYLARMFACSSVKEVPSEATAQSKPYWCSAIASI
jgi:hypothetical protein